MDVTYDTMPAAILDDTAEEQRKKRALGMPTAITPASAPARPLDTASTMTMPPGGGITGMRADASTDRPAARPLSQPDAEGWRHGIDLAGDANASRPVMPPGGSAAPPEPPAIPPTGMPAGIPSNPVSVAPGEPPAPQRPELHGWKKVLDVISQFSPIGRAIERRIPGSPGNFDVESATAAAQQAAAQRAGASPVNPPAGHVAEAQPNPTMPPAGLTEQTREDRIRQAVNDEYVRELQSGETQERAWELALSRALNTPSLYERDPQTGLLLRGKAWAGTGLRASAPPPVPPGIVRPQPPRSLEEVEARALTGTGLRASVPGAQPSLSPAGGASMTMPPGTVGPATQRLQALLAQQRPELHGWKKALDVASQFSPISRRIEAQIPGSPGNFDMKMGLAAAQAATEQGSQANEQSIENAAAQAQFATPAKRRAYMDQNPNEFAGVSDFERNDWVLSGKFPQRQPAQRPENIDREAYDFYVSKGMSPAEARKRVLQDAQDVKPERQTHTSPFEAFAYGSPGEKRAAQDFLDLEKRLGSRYRNPTEFEEKYKLYKEDPETYRALFGDKSGEKPDRATATRMLNYFDKRRREVSQDFTLDDAQKQEQLQEIERLEKPFMEAVQPGAAGGRAGNNDRVEVIHPNGQRGTIPRSQLPAAKKKGYREVSP